MGTLDQTKISCSVVPHINLQKVSKKRASTERSTKREGSSPVLSSNEGLGRLPEGLASQSLLLWPQSPLDLSWSPHSLPGVHVPKFQGAGDGERQKAYAGSLEVMINFLVVEELVSHLPKDQNCVLWHPALSGKSTLP